jgi:hypothetical protein
VCLRALPLSPLSSHLLDSTPSSSILSGKSYFSLEQVAHYNETNLKNHCIFHLGRSSIIIRPFRKTFTFLSGQVTHENLTISKIFEFYQLTGCLIQLYHFKKSFSFHKDHLFLYKSYLFSFEYAFQPLYSRQYNFQPYLLSSECAF